MFLVKLKVCELPI